MYRVSWLTWLQINVFIKEDKQQGLKISSCCLIVLLLLVGCGYSLGTTESKNVLKHSEEASKSILLRSVENPTIDTWLTYRIRSSLRDEVTARNLAHWVDSGDSDYLLDVKVVSFTMRSWNRGSHSQTLMYNASIALEVSLYAADTNAKVWSSGRISFSDTYETNSREEAAEELLLEVMQVLVSRMQNAF